MPRHHFSDRVFVGKCYLRHNQLQQNFDYDLEDRRRAKSQQLQQCNQELRRACDQPSNAVTTNAVQVDLYMIDALLLQKTVRSVTVCCLMAAAFDRTEVQSLD